MPPNPITPIPSTPTLLHESRLDSYPPLLPAQKRPSLPPLNHKRPQLRPDLLIIQPTQALSSLPSPPPNDPSTPNSTAPRTQSDASPQTRNRTRCQRSFQSLVGVGFQSISVRLTSMSAAFVNTGSQERRRTNDWSPSAPPFKGSRRPCTEARMTSTTSRSTNLHQPSLWKRSATPIPTTLQESSLSRPSTLKLCCNDPFDSIPPPPPPPPPTPNPPLKQVTTPSPSPPTIPLPPPSTGKIPCPSFVVQETRYERPTSGKTEVIETPPSSTPSPPQSSIEKTLESFPTSSQVLLFSRRRRWRTWSREGTRGLSSRRG